MKAHFIKNLSDVNIEESIEGNLFDAWRLFAKHWPADFYEGEEMIRFISGIPFPLCNNIMKTRFNDQNLDQQVKEAIQPILSRKLPMFWWIGPGTRPANIEQSLKKQGMVLADDVRGMAVEINSINIKTPSLEGLTIQRVSDPCTLKLWFIPFQEAFEVPDRVGDFFEEIMTSIGFSSEQPFHNYIAFLNGEPVACSTFYVGKNVVGIYNVATLTKARGRGIGAVMTMIGLEACLNLGYKVAVLHASKMGLPVYQKIGFKEFCRFSIYAWGLEHSMGR